MLAGWFVPDLVGYSCGVGAGVGVAQLCGHGRGRGCGRGREPTAQKKTAPSYAMELTYEAAAVFVNPSYTSARCTWSVADFREQDRGRAEVTKRRAEAPVFSRGEEARQI